jgi:HlyD family secretion protein
MIDVFGLLPGIPVEVFFKTNDRTPLEYLVEPLTDYLYLAFRDD